MEDFNDELLDRSRTQHSDSGSSHSDDDSGSSHSHSDVEYVMPPVTQRDVQHVQSDTMRQFASSLSSDADQLQQSLVCGICLEKFYHPVTLLCQHTFCKQCLVQQQERKCGVCKLRYVIPKEYNRIIDTTVKVFFHNEWQDRDAEEKCRIEKRSMRKHVESELRDELFNQATDIALQRAEREVEHEARNQRTNAGSANELGLGNPNTISPHVRAMMDGINDNLRDVGVIYSFAAKLAKIIAYTMVVSITLITSFFGLAGNFSQSGRMYNLGCALYTITMIMVVLTHVVCRVLHRLYNDMKARVIQDTEFMPLFSPDHFLTGELNERTARESFLGGMMQDRLDEIMQDRRPVNGIPINSIFQRGNVMAADTYGYSR